MRDGRQESPVFNGDTEKDNYVYRKYLVEVKIWRKRVLNRHLLSDEIASTNKAALGRLTANPLSAARGYNLELKPHF